jgi:hypothetical protein
VNSVIIVAPYQYDAEWQSRITSVATATIDAAGMIFVENEGSRLYIQRDDQVWTELEPHEIPLYNAVGDEPTIYAVSFIGIELCKKVLIGIADDSRLVIDDNCGLILPGDIFIRRLRDQPHWNWLEDSDRTH